MTAKVNNPRAADQLRREYDVLGDRLNLQLDDVVVPVAVVSDLTAGSSGVPVVRRAYAAFYQAGVAAEYTVWRLECPPGVIAIVRSITVLAPAASVGRVHFGASFAVVPTNVSVLTQFMDARLREEQTLMPSVHLVYDTQIPVLPGPYLYLPHDVAPSYVNHVEWVFGGRNVWDFIEFASSNVNYTIQATIEWDEVLVP